MAIAKVSLFKRSNSRTSHCFDFENSPSFRNLVKGSKHSLEKKEDLRRFAHARPSGEANQIGEYYGCGQQVSDMIIRNQDREREHTTLLVGHLLTSGKKSAIGLLP